jgi:hypothetical protein
MVGGSTALDRTRRLEYGDARFAVLGLLLGVDEGLSVRVILKEDGKYNEGLDGVEVGRWGGDGQRAHCRIRISSKNSSGSVRSIMFELHSPQYSEKLE